MLPPIFQLQSEGVKTPKTGIRLLSFLIYISIEHPLFSQVLGKVGIGNR